MYRHFFKRAFDILFSLIGLLVASPIFLIIMVLLAVINKGNPFFFQSRPGKNNKIFNLIKFKTMNDKCDKNGNLLTDIERLTAIGKIIRKTSLDEIPQLINVLKGDMSIIGPRPLLVEYLPLYSGKQARRHEVRPGITGWAQVKGRNAINWQEKFEYDVWYVDNLSFRLDLKIFFMTIKKVLFREGINKNSQETMDLFRGNN